VCDLPRYAAAVAAAAFLLPSSTSAEDAQAGRKKTELCQTCHGLDGLGRLPDAPHIAGQPAVYLERALRAYRSGERRNEMMSIVAKMLSDDDIRNLAAYYSAIKIEVKALP
jgi:cytochrome c553